MITAAIHYSDLAQCPAVRQDIWEFSGRNFVGPGERASEASGRPIVLRLIELYRLRGYANRPALTGMIAE